MNPLLDAAWELHQFFTTHKIPYVIIGGLAAQHWGEPRVTMDVDMTVMFSEGVADFVRLVLTRFPSRAPDLLDFARQTRVVTIRALNGEPVDISLGVPGYEAQMMARAVEYEITPGKKIRLCSAEDLIIHKCVAGRGKDLMDVNRVVQKQNDKLDFSYVRQWLGVFAEILGDKDVLDRFERTWRVERRAVNKIENKPSTTKLKRKKRR